MLVFQIISEDLFPGTSQKASSDVYIFTNHGYFRVL